VGYIPKDAKWFLAEIVQEITVEGDPRNILHTNTVLVRADSAEEAYQKAMELGVAGEQSYKNPDGNVVTFRSRGLHDLNVIHDELVHGAELIYSEAMNLDESAVQKWITAKDDLGVFRTIIPGTGTGPDYRFGEVMQKLYEHFPHLRPDNRSKPN